MANGPVLVRVKRKLHGTFLVFFVSSRSLVSPAYFLDLLHFPLEAVSLLYQITQIVIETFLESRVETIRDSA